jgi:REP element-mobilizing transposase RayT
MEKGVQYFRRKLPHYQPHRAMFFITFRLANSLPANVIIQLKKEYKEVLRRVGKRAASENVARELHTQRKRHLAGLDDFLNRALDGPKWLGNDRIARIVADSLHYWDGKRYELFCYCIMPNHVHLVIGVGKLEKLSDEEPLLKGVGQLERLSNKEASSKGAGQRNNLSRGALSLILFSIKRYTAREANNILGRTGAFWQHESYDHIVRDGNELSRIIRYVKENPMKARLVNDWKDWKWLYVKKDL